MKEVWRNIVGYEGLYQVSNWGRVKRLAGKGCRQERILKPNAHKGGYYYIMLSKNNTGNFYSVHRLVAQAFIPNPDNLPCVNHRDENPSNNFVFVREDGSVDFAKSNLEWCTYEYNNKYGTRLEKISEKLTNGKKSKAIVEYLLTGKPVKIWISISEIKRQKEYRNAHIAECCKGTLKTDCNRQWRYLDDVNPLVWLPSIEPPHIRQAESQSLAVEQYTMNNQLICIWPSTREIERQTGYQHNFISRCCLGKCKTAYGYIWKRKKSPSDNSERL